METRMENQAETQTENQMEKKVASEMENLRSLQGGTFGYRGQSKDVILIMENQMALLLNRVRMSAQESQH